LDGKHTVFGEVTEGYDIIEKIETFGTGSGKPRAEVTITDCGEVKQE
jgi:peptidylprolyl isomerase